MAGEHLYSVVTQGGFYTTGWKISEIGTENTVNIASPYSVIDKNYFDAGRNGGYVFCVVDYSSLAFTLIYTDLSQVITVTEDDVKRLIFATGDFPASRYTAIRVEKPMDINVDDNGNATATIFATYNNNLKVYTLNISSNPDVSAFNGASCGDGKGDFASTGEGTITYKYNQGDSEISVTLPAYSGSKLTLTDNYAFVVSAGGIGSSFGGTVGSGYIKQYALDGTLLHEYTDLYDVCNTRLSVVDVDALLQRWGF